MLRSYDDTIKWDEEQKQPLDASGYPASSRGRIINAPTHLSSSKKQKAAFTNTTDGDQRLVTPSKMYFGAGSRDVMSYDQNGMTIYDPTNGSRLAYFTSTGTSLGENINLTPGKDILFDNGELKLTNASAMSIESLSSVNFASGTFMTMTNGAMGLANSTLELASGSTLGVENGSVSLTGTSTLSVAAGATTLGGTLSVTGKTTVVDVELTSGSTLGVEDGNVSLTGTSTLSVAAGATTLGGTLGVTGKTTVVDVDMNGITNLNGTTTLGTQLNANQKLIRLKDATANTYVKYETTLDGIEIAGVGGGRFLHNGTNNAAQWDASGFQARKYMRSCGAYCQSGASLSVATGTRKLLPMGTLTSMGVSGSNWSSTAIDTGNAAVAPFTGTLRVWARVYYTAVGMQPYYAFVRVYNSANNSIFTDADEIITGGGFSNNADIRNSGFCIVTVNAGEKVGIAVEQGSGANKSLQLLDFMAEYIA